MTSPEPAPIAPRLRPSRHGRLRLYAPLAVLLLGQAALVTLLPSTGTSDNPLGTLGFDPTAADPDFDPGNVDGGDVAAGGNGGTATTGPGGSNTSIAGGAGPGGGDTSHCTADGRQVAVTVHSPPCLPRFTGDNGGATYPGVTAGEIEVIYIVPEGDPQLDLLLAQAGYGEDPEVLRDFGHLAVDYINTHYELYGRKLKITFIEEGCPAIPDEDRCRAVVRHVIEQRPFAVLWLDYAYPNLIGELARAGIMSVDLGAFDGSHYDTFAPYRWSVWTDGRQTAEATAEFFCQSMAGRKATHSGLTIHPSIGRRGKVDRKLGIVSLDYGAFLASAERLRGLLARCGGGSAKIYTYDLNVETLPQRCQAITASLINDRVTTVVWAGEASGPLFCTPTMTPQSYQPEHLITGAPLVDINGFARLFDPKQWRHAFGVSVLTNPLHYSKTEEAAVWRAMRPNRQFTCKACIWTDLRTLGFMVQVAGPDLTPVNLARAVLSSRPTGGWQATGGNPTIERVAFAPGDYTALSDWRAVWWDPDGRDELDGSGGGAYVAVDGGRRYVLGEYRVRELRIPVAAG